MRTVGPTQAAVEPDVGAASCPADERRPRRGDRFLRGVHQPRFQPGEVGVVPGDVVQQLSRVRPGVRVCAAQEDVAGGYSGLRLDGLADLAREHRVKHNEVQADQEQLLVAVGQIEYVRLEVIVDRPADAVVELAA